MDVADIVILFYYLFLADCFWCSYGVTASGTCVRYIRHHALIEYAVRVR